MKTIHVLLFILIVQNIFGQQTKIIRKAVEISKEQTFNLTSTNSRAYISIDIPENTVEWYIAFTSFADKNTVSPINLLAQVASTVDPTGIASIAANSLTAPNGTSRCDVYVTDVVNRQTFMNLSDNFTRYDNISRENITHGIIKVNNTYKGNFQILLYNPSYTTDVNVTVEVTAIIDEKTVDMSIWSKEKKDELYNKISVISTITNGLRVAPTIANCAVDKVTIQKTPDEISKMTETEFNNFTSIKMSECKKELSGSGEKTEEQKKGYTYGNLAWKSFEQGNVDKCIELSKKSLELDPSLGWVKANLGLCSLIKNDEIAATEYYIDAISIFKKDQIYGRKYVKTCIDDIDNAVKKYPNMKGYEEIKELLKMEL